MPVKYVTKKFQPYNTTRIKSRSFMTNISYVGVNEENLFDRSFVFDVYVLTTKNINPFLLEQKICDIKNREMINIFWEECNDASFYKHICKPENFLTGKMSLIHVADIMQKYLEKDEENFEKIKKKLIKNKKIFLFVYSSAYPEVYSFVEK